LSAKTDDGVMLIRLTEVRTVSAQNMRGTEEDSRKAQAVSSM